jgi:hypothetical protein
LQQENGLFVSMSDVGMSAAFWTMKSLEEFCMLKEVCIWWFKTCSLLSSMLTNISFTARW